jgi:nucleoside-diphosphate-sugar epimerase
MAREKLLRSYCQTVNRPYRILRLCNVIGNDPRANKRKAALEWMMAQVKRGEDVTVYAGDNYRNFLHVDDVCRAINLCLTKAPFNTIIHIGAPRSDRVIDLLRHVKTQTKSASRIDIVPSPRFHQIVQVPDFFFDTTRLRQLGFVPEMDAYQAVDRVVANL